MTALRSICEKSFRAFEKKPGSTRLLVFCRGACKSAIVCIGYPMADERSRWVTEARSLEPADA